MKKLTRKTKKILIIESLLFLLGIIFNISIHFLMMYFSKESQLLSSAMERHEISRMEYEIINNLQNNFSDIQFLGTVIILVIMLIFVIKHFYKK